MVNSVLLKIIDKYTDVGGVAIQVVLEVKSGVESFFVEEFSSPFTDNFNAMLAWYFKEYPLVSMNKIEGEDDRGVFEKLIKNGEYLGDKLLGEDHQLYRFKENIERQGYQSLRVEIESSRIEFFEEAWEMMVLPDSKYALASVTKEFVRKFIGPGQLIDCSEIHYDLKVRAPIQEKVDQLSIVETDSIDQVSQEHQKTNDEPLRILHIVSRPQSIGVSIEPSNGLNLSLNSMRLEGAIEYEIYQARDWDQIESVLADSESPVHLVHYDGPIIMANADTSLVLGSDNHDCSMISIDFLVEQLYEFGVRVLSLDVREYIKDGETIPAYKGLANIASIASRLGSVNIIGLSHIVDPWTSSKCFQTIFEMIAKGLSLGQSVVEARKKLQAQVEHSLFSVEPRLFHPWTLLVHYGGQAVTFFKTSHVAVELYDSLALRRAKGRLLGFREEMLLPANNNVCDRQVFDVVSSLGFSPKAESNKAVFLTGEQGSGKTHLSHMACLHLAHVKRIEYAFYFDYGSGFYSVDNILAMIGPVLGVESPVKSNDVESFLSKVGCCFVLDNVSKDNFHAEEKEELLWLELSDFISNNLSLGHSVIVAGRGIPLAVPFNEVEMGRWSVTEQKVLASNVLRSASADNKNYSDSLLAIIGGNPFLTEKILPLLDDYLDSDQLSLRIEQEINSSGKGSKVDRFYEWQWATLPSVWQKLLLLCSQVEGLILEMVMIACDKKEGFKPALELFNQLDATAGVASESSKDLGELRVVDAIRLWEKSGFLNVLAHGHIIDPQCLSFLSRKRNEEFNCYDKEKSEFSFSQVVCEGVRLLSQKGIETQAPAISHSLLVNRKSWVMFFETLWFSGDYAGFLRAKSSFDLLLQSSNLGEELAGWSLDLLDRSLEVVDVTCIDSNLAWLVLAVQALEQPEAMDSECLMHGKEVWREWFDRLPDELKRDDLGLFFRVAIFLESYYMRGSDWDECALIGRKSLEIYLSFDAWPRVISALKTISSCYFKLGKVDEARSFEQRIVDDIPYENSPPGFEFQQLLETVLSRVSRNEFSNAQLLLDKIYSMKDADRFGDALEAIQSQISSRLA